MAVPVDVATRYHTGGVTHGGRRALPAALGVATVAGVLLPDGPWVLGAIAGQVGIASALTPFVGRAVRAVVAIAALLAVPPVVLMVTDVDPSLVARISAATCGTLFLVLGSWDRDRSARRTSGAEVLHAVAGFGVLLLANSYLLVGPHGLASVMEYDHVRQAAAIGSAISAGSDISDWAAMTAVDVRAQPSALSMAFSVWAVRVGSGSPPATGAGLITLVAVVSAASMVLAWLSLAFGSGLAVSSLRSRRATAWTALGLALVLLGPLLWLRVHGRWPEAMALGMLVLAATILTSPARPHVHATAPLAGFHRRAALVLSMPPLLLACLAWPVMCVPIGVAVALSWVAQRRRGASGAMGVSMNPVVLMVPVVVGVWWAARTMPGVSGQGTGPTSLGGPDWRLLVVVALLARALIALPDRGRPRAATAVISAVGVVSATMAVSGIALDYVTSQISSGNVTELAGLMGLLAVAAGLPTLTGWMVTGDDHQVRWAIRSWRTLACLTAVSCTAVWLPWGETDGWNGGTVGISEALPAWSRAAVGTEVMVGRDTIVDAQSMRCGWDGLIRWPVVSPRVGAAAATSIWAAALAGRTDEAGWGATRYVYPQYGTTPTPDDQFRWLRAIGPSDPPRRILWVLPDDIALAVAAMVPSAGVPAGITIRAVGEQRFRQELAECATTGRVA